MCLKLWGFSVRLYRVSQIPGNITSSPVNGNNWSTYLPSLTLEVFFTPSVTQSLWMWHPVITWKSRDFQEIKSQLIQGPFEHTLLVSLAKNSSEGESEAKTNVKQIAFHCFPEVPWVFILLYEWLQIHFYFLFYLLFDSMNLVYIIFNNI